MQAPSKMTRKSTYTHILNFLLSRNAHTPRIKIFRVTTSIMWGGFTYSNAFSFGKSQKKLENSFGENYHRYVMPVVIL